MSVAARITVGILLMVFAGWFVFLAAEASAPSNGNGVELKAIKYPDLVKAVRAQRGKVVVIDVWANYCVHASRNSLTWLSCTNASETRDWCVCRSPSILRPKTRTLLRLPQKY